MGTHSDPQSLQPARVLIGLQERNVSSVEDILGFIRECDGDDFAELLSTQTRGTAPAHGDVLLALKGRLEAFRHVLTEDAPQA